ncbi:YkvA family protein [Pararhizobium gei]|uniref:YkvA family protein n=1 Tax=Pararhizobium gei TaxID=1395951 RepID=UPI0023D9AD81|nr:YkvA family protein [Rhizobium gei]
MDDVKIGEILLPGEESEQEAKARKVERRFWPTMKRAVRQIPFSRDVVAAYYCARDPATPMRTRGIILGALAYFVLPFDFIPDVLAMVGFSDDVAVLTAAFAAVAGQIKDRHYVRADEALQDKLPE